MSRINLASIVGYLKPTPDALRTQLEAELKEMGYQTITDNDNYLIGVPSTLETPEHPKVCFVAHMDTISRKNQNAGLELLFRGSKITNNDAVLGADDRAGVFAIMETIKGARFKPLVIFTNYEETGGIGVKELVKSKAFDPYSKYVNLFVEPDRQDHRQYVWYCPTLPKEIHAFTQQFGFKPDNGSYSDVKDLTQAYRIPHVNLSVGYYHQHSSNETLDVIELDYTQKAMAKMLLAPIPKTVMTQAEAGQAWGGAHTPTTSRTGQGGWAATTAGTSKTTRGTYYSYQEYLDAVAKLEGEDSLAIGPKSPGQEEAPSTWSEVTPSKSTIVIERDTVTSPLFSETPEKWSETGWKVFSDKCYEQSRLADENDEVPFESEGEVSDGIDEKEISHKGKLVSAREYALIMQDELDKLATVTR